MNVIRAALVERYGHGLLGTDMTTEELFAPVIDHLKQELETPDAFDADAMITLWCVGFTLLMGLDALAPNEDNTITWRSLG
jgi:hypothetical protein